MPRGRLLCLGGDNPNALARQIERVEATGNQAVTLDTVTTQARIAMQGIDGIIAGGAMRKLATTALAAREGAILPLLSAEDAMERFFLEKVVTVNTTAAGGNALLLADL